MSNPTHSILPPTSGMPFIVLLLFSLLLFPCSPLLAQNYNTILDDDIRSVQLHLRSAPLTLPVVQLRAGPGTLVLEFDRLGTDIKDYSYTIVHCNHDWTPSELIDNEYIDGFTTDRITEYEASINTLTQYVHFTLQLPNQNMRWNKSGNYLLQVYDEDDDHRLVMVRRFMVVEPVWRVEPMLVRPALAGKFNTHHEIDFNVVHKGTRIPNPQNDVFAYVLQNGRWDNVIGPLRPYITRQDQLVFDFQDKIVFPAGKEWRYFDMGTFDVRGDRVRQISEQDDYYEVTVRADESRLDRPYLFERDINGRFSIENQNPNHTMLECDYARVLFSLLRNRPFDDDDVYVFGELTDWQLKPEFRMEYDQEAKSYYCEPLLKQGVYNYKYVLVNRATGAVNEEELEGNWHETSNTYNILVYFRPFGTRYDRLMTPAVSVDSKNK
jgi:hypothetical protein